jgi:hypothetical protein
MTAEAAPHWLGFSQADFEVSRAPRGAARKRAAERDQGGLFFVATPVTRPARHAPLPEQLPGQDALFGEDGEQS